MIRRQKTSPRRIKNWFRFVFCAAFFSIFIPANSVAQGIFGGASYSLLPGFYTGYNGVSQSVFADVNGDGIMDIVTANNDYSPGTVSVVLGRGDGGFMTAFPLVVGASPTLVAVGDFNGDGIPDIAAFGSTTSGLSSVYTLYILLGKGGGVFAPAIAQTVTQNFTFLTAADMNGDGKDDLIGTSSGQIAVFSGTAGGIAAAPIVTACDSGNSLLAIADLDGDGKRDIIQYDRSTYVDYYTVTVYSPSIFYGLGNGSFKPKQPLATALPPTALTIADVNGDGKPDIITASGGDVEIILSAGSGIFYQPVAYAVASARAAAIAVSVFNSDGKPDIAVIAGSSYGGNLYTLLNNGNGTYRSGTSYALPTYTANIHIGDGNGDGKPDLLTVDNKNATFFAGNDSGAFAAPLRNTLANIQAVTDFNGDHKPDALTISDANLQVNPGVGDGTFGAPIVTPTGISIGYTAVGDINGDGRPDVAVLGLTGTSVTVGVFTGNGDGSFALLHSYAIPGATSAVAIGMGDFNGDGKQDLLVVTGVPYPGYSGFPYGYTASYTLLLGDGAGGLTLQPAQKIVDQTLSYQMITGDFNGDGRTDFAAYYTGINPYQSPQYNYSSAYLLNGFGNADATFTTSIRSISMANYQNPSPGFGYFAVGDFDGDGRGDLVTGLSITGGGYYYSPGGTSLTITPSKPNPTIFSLTSNPVGPMVTGDFNGDGATDLIISANGGLYLYTGNGDGTVTASDFYNVPISAAFAADLNGDGRPDLIAAGSVLLNTGAAAVDVTGSLNLDSLAANAAPQLVHFALRDGAGKTVLTRAAFVGADGAFTLYGVPVGNYTIHIKSDKYLAVNVALQASANGAPTLSATLPAGDANNDNSVDSTDFGILIGAFNTSASVPDSGYDPAADFNGDGFVDSSDFGLLIGNFGEMGAS